MYVPNCDNCEHRRDCAMFMANRELKETIWNMGREKSGRHDYFLNGKYHKTNADLIRAMADEELALYLDNMQGLAYINGFDSEPIRLYPNNYGAWLDWLKQNATEGGD